MNIEIEQLKLRLIETQMQLLQYQHKEVSANIKQIELAQSQVRFDASVDAKDLPSEATIQPDQFAGS
jgi:hypothetical protein